MHASLVPTATDLAGLIGYVLGNPFLFISSSTVMTTGLVLGAVVTSFVPRGAPALRLAAPTVAMVLAYFGFGTIVLATEILVRFHATIPAATETLKLCVNPAMGMRKVPVHAASVSGEGPSCSLPNKRDRKSVV